VKLACIRLWLRVYEFTTGISGSHCMAFSRMQQPFVNQRGNDDSTVFVLRWTTPMGTEQKDPSVEFEDKLIVVGLLIMALLLIARMIVS
jgi:hypothetical protein